MSEQHDALQIGDRVVRTVLASWEKPAAAHGLTVDEFAQVKQLQGALEEEFGQEYDLGRVVRVYKRTKFISSYR